MPFETLDVVTSSPVLLPSGRVHEQLYVADGALTKGGHFDEGVMYIGGMGQRKKFPPLPQYPTRQDALKAIKEFEPIFSGFPFVDPETETKPLETTSYSCALAGILSLVARPHLGISAIPIIGSSAPMRRSGKTKIPEACSMAALGHKPTTAHYHSEEELGKFLVPLMQAGDRCIVIDNIERPLQSSKLCILITNGMLDDRILGKSEDIFLKNFSVIFATGNNLTFGGDLSARALRIDIDPGQERPESRAFSFDPVARAQELHPQLCIAALTCLRAFLLAKMPWETSRQRWGGFERWDSLICGTLLWLGYADPFDARERIIKDDPIRQTNQDLLEVWFEEYGEQIVNLGKIRRDKGDTYEQLLREGEWNGYFARTILRRLQGQFINGYRLVRAGGRSSFQVLRTGEQIGMEEVAGFKEPPAKDPPF